MKPKILLVVLLVFFFSLAQAIVIVPPTIYFVTLSLVTFIANSFIGLLAWIALSGLLNKSFFGKKISEIFSQVFSATKKIFIAVVSMLIAVFLVSPIEFFSILLGGVVCTTICGFLLFLSNYSKFRIVDLASKKNILKSTAIFSVFILLLFSVSAFFSLEIKVLDTEKKEFEDLSVPFGAPVASEMFDYGMDKAREISEEPLVEGDGEKIEKPLDEKDLEIIKEIVSDLWFYPQSSEMCIVKIGKQEFNFKPKNSCYFLENNFPTRIFCPEKVSINEVNQQGAVSVVGSGSCSEKINVVIENGFKVEST